MEKVKERKSNLDLLRIIAILLVIMSHFMSHGIIVNVESKNLFVNYLFRNIFCTGAIANNIFIILSGYFMVKSKPNYKKIISLILEMIFYSVIIYCILCLVKIEDFNYINMLKSFFPIFFGNWFCIAYIIMYLLSPILNYLLNNLDRDTMKKYIIIIFVIFSVVPTVSNNVLEMSNYSIFILSYLIGGYTRMYFADIDRKKCLKWLLIFVFISITSSLLMFIVGMKLNIGKLIESSSYLYTHNYSSFAIIIAMLMVMMFSKINIKSNKIISSMALSSLGIYLIHDNAYLRNVIWNIVIPNESFIGNWYFIFFAICKVTCVFVLCLFFDKLRIIMFGRIENSLSSKIYSIFSKIKNRESR